MAKKASTTQLVHIRMPKAFHGKLMREAERLGQTLNAVILLRLEAADQYQALIRNATGRDKTHLELKDAAERLTRVADELVLKMGGKKYIFDPNDPLGEALIEVGDTGAKKKDAAND